MLRHEKSLGHALKLSAACIALTIPSLAFAQDAPQAEQETFDQGDIIVTATRRTEALADVPLAVSAVNSESLQNSGANDIRQLNQLAPSLLVSSTGTEANGAARIRGIGTVGDNPGLESSVAVFIDGVYRSRSGIGLNELGEIDRIEVLRGPQGTLFGRNASAGLIHVISKKPEFDFGGTAEATYGNYDFYRFAGGITGPITESIAARIDGVYVKRDGFFRVVNAAGPTGERVNDRDRFFVRGQLLFEPSDAVSFRLIGDYTKRTESCCAGVYRSTNETFDPTPGAPGDFGIRATNRVVNILNGFGAVFPTPNDRFSRQVAISPGRTLGGKTTDGGISGELNWNFGGANLTSITAYREYKASQAGDVDYSTVDLLYRANDGTAFRQFKTLTQELRLQGSAFDNKLDWLIGGFYTNEKLELLDNLQFGNDYGAFMACRLVSGVGRPAVLGGPAPGNDDPALRSVNAPGCLSPTGIGFLNAAFGTANAAGGTDASQLIASLTRLGNIRNVGNAVSAFNQKSENYAFFTHNVIRFTDTFNLTLGARYTNETKTLRAGFNNNNTGCTAQQAANGAATLGTANATTRALLGGSTLFSCLFNFSSALNTLALNDRLKDDQITGTAVLSWKPTPDLLTYASYSKGYKAGGFNLDASALGSPTVTPTPASVANLRFDAEKVNAFEVGVKYNGRRFNLNVAAFRQEFDSFQLNTFNGLFFLVQNVNACTDLIGGSGADEDLSSATGTCDPKNVKPGVISQGVELEASVYPAPNFAVTAGFTYSDTKYENDLVGRSTGTALANELFQLPGSNLSNAPKYVVTGSVAWTPDIGGSGLSGLVYVDTRMTSDYNTGSDLLPEKVQDGFAVFNARIGLRGPEQKWAVELWAQNLLNKNYDQVAFNSPLQASGTGSLAQQKEFGSATSYSSQLFSAFLSEPRTVGITLRGKF
ncbi:MAG: TonB-dependent receptor [Sphingomonadaceae bacterium]|nr:TonB-dependent receptor [Sphingomonadaceae bacterium]MBJ7388018.1 TonB-dependent receptor [Sphingomonadaceae bacterium]MBJ7525984.1 TonB-dependent receptor [Sphingomonadaceae bacterium]